MATGCNLDGDWLRFDIVCMYESLLCDSIGVLLVNLNLSWSIWWYLYDKGSTDTSCERSNSVSRRLKMTENYCFWVLTSKWDSNPKDRDWPQTAHLFLKVVHLLSHKNFCTLTTIKSFGIRAPWPYQLYRLNVYVPSTDCLYIDWCDWWHCHWLMTIWLRPCQGWVPFCPWEGGCPYLETLTLKPANFQIQGIETTKIKNHRQMPLIITKEAE